MWLSFTEEQVELHILSQAHTGIVLLYKSSVHAACLTDLRLDQIITITFNLKIVVHYFIYRDDSFSNLHQRHARLLIEARIQVQLVED